MPFLRESKYTVAHKKWVAIGNKILEFPRHTQRSSLNRQNNLRYSIQRFEVLQMKVTVLMMLSVPVSAAVNFAHLRSVSIFGSFVFIKVCRSYWSKLNSFNFEHDLPVEECTRWLKFFKHYETIATHCASGSAFYKQRNSFKETISRIKIRLSQHNSSFL